MTLRSDIDDAIKALENGNSDAAWHILKRVAVPKMPTDLTINLHCHEMGRKWDQLKVDDDIEPMRNIVKEFLTEEAGVKS